MDRKAEFEKHQQHLKQMMARGKLLEVQDKNQTIQATNAWLASVFQELLKYKEFREFLDHNFEVEQGVDHKERKLYVTVNCLNPTFTKDPIEESMELPKGYDVEKKPETSGEDGENEGQHLREEDRQSSPGVVEGD